MKFKAVLYFAVIVEAESAEDATEILRENVYTLPGTQCQILLTPLAPDAEQQQALGNEETDAGEASC